MWDHRSCRRGLCASQPRRVPRGRGIEARQEASWRGSVVVVMTVVVELAPGSSAVASELASGVAVRVAGAPRLPVGLGPDPGDRS